MALFTDQMGREIDIPSPPQKIVSLVPSQTELLFHLGLDEEVSGITKFCIHPQHWHQTKMRVGGTKNLHLETIKNLQPDLIIANKEENVQEQVEALADDFAVWISDVNNLPQALQMIHSIGAITGKEAKAAEINSNIQKGMETFLKPAGAPTVVYLIWQEPYMTVGGDTFIGDMIELAGYTNLFRNNSRYPAITIDELKTLKPEVLFLSSEPYPFGQKHLETFQELLPQTKVVLVDGEMFSWYGSRLQQAPAYFSDLQQQLGAI
ncbi:MAG: helical backbone metal receptor [Chitinophagaceae bacterium]